MTRSERVRRPLRRARLVLHAWRLHAAVQLLRSDESLPSIRERLLMTPGLPSGVQPADAVWAAAMAARLQRHCLGRLDTCLLRSLVAGALVADAPEVAVRVGVHPADTATGLLDAHAWLTVADRVVGPAEDDRSEPFEEVLTVSMERPA